MALIWGPGRRLPDEKIALDRSEPWGNITAALAAELEGTDSPALKRYREKRRIEEDYYALVRSIEARQAS